MKNILPNLVTVFLLFSNAYVFSQAKPQEPHPPFAYLSEDVEFNAKTDEVKLAGTLTLPKEGTNFPAVILISGSGAQDRNSELLGHKPFLVISDYLTKNGIAVLRVDDRGKGMSGGDYALSSMNDFKGDTEAATAFLRKRKDIDTAKIGLIGHSLGGVLAPMIASEDKNIAFIILLAGTGMRGDKLMLLQKKNIEEKMGMSNVVIENGQEDIGGAYKIILGAKSYSPKLEKKLKKHFEEKMGNQLSEDLIKAISHQLNYPWMFDFIRFDPATVLAKVNCPVLALNGSKDVQVPAKPNLQIIEESLKSNDNQDVTIIELEGLNHLFQECNTGLPQEYAVIEQTFSPDVLALMKDWIVEKMK